LAPHANHQKSTTPTKSILTPYRQDVGKLIQEQLKLENWSSVRTKYYVTVIENIWIGGSVNKEPQKGLNTLIDLIAWELWKYRNNCIFFLYWAVASVVWWGEISGVGRDSVASCRLETKT